MRSLLLISFATLALSFSGFTVSAATVGDAARSTNTDWAAHAPPAANVAKPELVYFRGATPALAAGPRDGAPMSLTDEVETLASVAGAGLIVTLAAVGLRRVWWQDPIRDPLGEEPGLF